MNEMDEASVAGKSAQSHDGVPLTARHVGKTYGDDDDANPVIGDISFSLKAGDDCVYIDDAKGASRGSNTGTALVPVFCPARGAGWTSLSLLTRSEPGQAR